MPGASLESIYLQVTAPLQTFKALSTEAILCPCMVPYRTPPTVSSM